MKEKIDIKEWLKSKGLTIEEFAHSCGVSRQFFSDVINGKREPSSEVALNMYRQTGYQVSFFDFKPSYKKYLTIFKKIAKEN